MRIKQKRLQQETNGRGKQNIPLKERERSRDQRKLQKQT